MTSLDQFIRARRAELIAELTELDRRRARIHAELAGLDAAEAAAEAAAAAALQQDAALIATEDEPSELHMVSATQQRTPIRKGSIKEKVLAVLADNPAGADAHTILTLIQERFNENIPRPSLSPQLSRLKGEGWVTLNGKVWSLAVKNETPDVGASGVSKTDGEATPSNESREGHDLFD